MSTQPAGRGSRIVTDADIARAEAQDWDRWRGEVNAGLEGICDTCHRIEGKVDSLARSLQAHVVQDATEFAGLKAALGCDEDSAESSDTKKTVDRWRWAGGVFVVLLSLACTVASTIAAVAAVWK